MQPAIFPGEEEEYEVSLHTFPIFVVSSSKLAEAGGRVSGLVALRERRKEEGIQRLRRLWDVLGVETAERARVLEQAAHNSRVRFRHPLSSALIIVSISPHHCRIIVSSSSHHRLVLL